MLILVSYFMFCLMFLNILFHVQICRLEKRLLKVKNELKSMKEEAKKDLSQKTKETTKDTVI
jgi:hypothetical protein